MNNFNKKDVGGIFMSIDTNGFLSPDLENYKCRIRENYSHLVDLFNDFNNFAQRMVFNINVHNKNPEEIFIACLYIRSLSSYQSFFLLIERGIVNEAKIILRTLIEILFQLVAINKNKNFVKEYALQDSRHKKKLVHKIIELNKISKEKFLDKDLNSLLETIQVDIDENEIKELKTYDYAKKAGLLDFYYTAYTLLSNTVHASSRDIETHLVFDDQKNIISFDWGPSGKGIEMLLITSIETFYIILTNVLEKFKVEKDLTFKNLEKKYNNCKKLYADKSKPISS
jgi:hypothetical protein